MMLYTCLMLVLVLVCFINCSTLCSPWSVPQRCNPIPPRSLDAYVIAWGKLRGNPILVRNMVIAAHWFLLSFSGGITVAGSGYPTVGR